MTPWFSGPLSSQNFGNFTYFISHTKLFIGKMSVTTVAALLWKVLQNWQRYVALILCKSKCDHLSKSLCSVPHHSTTKQHEHTGPVASPPGALEDDIGDKGGVWSREIHGKKDGVGKM